MMSWNADKTTVEKSVTLERLSAVLEKDEWIIDGNWFIKNCNEQQKPKVLELLKKYGDKNMIIYKQRRSG